MRKYIYYGNGHLVVKTNDWKSIACDSNIMVNINENVVEFKELNGIPKKRLFAATITPLFRCVDGTLMTSGNNEHG